MIEFYDAKNKEIKVPEEKKNISYSFFPLFLLIIRVNISLVACNC